MSEQLTPAIMRARLEQLGTLEVRRGISRGDVIYSGHLEIRAEIHRNGSTHYRTVASSTMAQKWSDEEECPIDDHNTSIVTLWVELSTRPHIAGVPDHAAFWWDPRLQDWGTSPNAPEGWPAPAKDPEDIRERLAVRLEGIEVEYWHGQDYPSEDIHWTATAHKWCGYGETQDAAYLDIWWEMTKKY